MPTRSEQWPAGTPCWVDLAVPDLEGAKQFYGEVMGWSFMDSGEEYGHYNIAQIDGRAAAAIGPLQEQGQPTVWTLYFASDDADATAKLITENGGTMIAEPFDIPASGRMAVALDPVGAAFGVWQSAGMHGVEVYGEPGSLVWVDARLPDPDTGRGFYGAVFGFGYENLDGAPGDYTTFTVDGARNGESFGGIGGMMGAPEGTPAHWLSYFIVPDVNAVGAAAVEAGGTTMGAPFDTPYGPMLGITDPFGATFFVVGQVPAG